MWAGRSKLFEDELKAHVRIWLPRIADGSEDFWIREPMKHDSGERDQGRDRHTIAYLTVMGKASDDPLVLPLGFCHLSRCEPLKQC